jgi:hypothetical protein
MKLTRLAATVSTPTTGRVRVYLTVRRLPAGRIFATPRKSGSEVVTAVAVAHGENQGGTGPFSARTLDAPSAVGSGVFILGEGVNQNIGVTVAIVPDGITRVQWTFTGAGFGILRPHPVQRQYFRSHRGGRGRMIRAMLGGMHLCCWWWLRTARPR